MLNSHLIEHMGSIHRQRSTGVLTVSSPGLRLRFAFEGGDPVAIDLGADKELIIVDELAFQHKIDEEGLAQLTTQYQAGAGSIADIAKATGLVNEDDVAAATRGMVESTLLRCFGNMHFELSFNAQDNVASFDFSVSAVRLRIGTPQLLSTVQPRVAEVERIQAEVPANAIFVLDESSHVTTELSDIEKQVLDWVDGQRTVEEIAIGCRESTTNLARHLLELSEKRVLRLDHVALAHESAELPMSSGRSASGTFSMPPMPTKQQSRWGIKTVLLGTLGLVLLVAYGLSLRQNDKRQQEQDLNELNASISIHAWLAAQQHVTTIEEDAKIKNDLPAIDHAAALRRHYEAELQRERQEIAAFISSYDFVKAGNIIKQLPPEAATSELTTLFQQATEDAAQQLVKLKARLQRSLDAGRTTDALNVIKDVEPYFQVELSRALDAWRDSQLEKAVRPGTFFGEKLRAATQVAALQPSSDQLDRLHVAQDIIIKQRKVLSDVLRDLAARSATGAYNEVIVAWNAEQMSEHVADSDLAVDADKIKKDNEQRRNELTGQENLLKTLVRDGDDALQMRQAVQQTHSLFTQRPQASNTGALKLWSTVVSDIANCIHDDTAADEIKTLNAWLAGQSDSSETAVVVKERISRLENMENKANDSLERARTFARQDNWEQAARVLDDLIARQEWRKTAAYSAAVIELNAAKNLQSQRHVLRQDLNRAMDKGDSDQVMAIARKMGLKNIPLRLESVPSGAEVLRDGKIIGSTPLTLDVPPVERTDLRFDMRYRGFVTAQVDAVSATAGWRIFRYLEREAVYRFKTGIPLTIRPVVSGGRVWTGNSQFLVAMTADGKIDRWVLDSVPSDMSQPLYVPPCFVDDGVWLPTNEGTVIKTFTDVEKAQLRVPLAKRTNQALAYHVSAFIAGRRNVMCAGTDGLLHAMDIVDFTAKWEGPAGAAFCCAPLCVGDEAVIIARRDGHLESVNPDEGTLIAREDLGFPIAGSWTENGQIHAYAGGWLWHWDGKTLTKDELPTLPIIGGSQAYVAGDNHVFLYNEKNQEWRDSGRVEGSVTNAPVRWGDHVAIAIGTRLVVLGNTPFILTFPFEIVNPQVINEYLVVPCSNGDVFTYKM